MHLGGNFAEATRYAAVNLPDLAPLAELAGFASHSRFVAELICKTEAASQAPRGMCEAGTIIGKRKLRIVPRCLHRVSLEARIGKAPAFNGRLFKR